MSQNDLIIDNAPGAAFRQDVMGALQAIASWQSGTSEPLITYPCQEWADLSTLLLKKRNTANTAWITIGRLNESFLGIKPADIAALAATSNFSDVADKMTARYNLGITQPAKNALRNGRFEIWQRQTSFSAPGSTTARKVATADGWIGNFFGDGGTSASLTILRQAHSPGQNQVPFNPNYYLRVSNTTQGSSLGVNSYHVLAQSIESVNSFSGETVTISFYARSSIPSKRIAVEFVQDFGNGGTPSSIVTGIGATQFTLSSTWAKYTATIPIPSISGKVVGSNGFSSSLVVNIWLQCGSANATRTGGAAFGWQGTGDIDFSDIQVQRGVVSTPIEERDFAAELLLCRRYYQKSYNYETYAGASTEQGALHVASPVAGTGSMGGTAFFSPTMRIVPGIQTYDRVGNAGKCFKGVDNIPTTLDQIGNNSARIWTTDATSASLFICHWTADAEY